MESQAEALNELTTDDLEGKVGFFIFIFGYHKKLMSICLNQRIVLL